MMRILIADSIAQKGIELLQAEGWEVEVRASIGPDDLRGLANRFDAIIVRGRSRIDASVLAAADSLRVIGRAGAGVDNIDVESATRQGVLVMNTPGGNSVSVAEHTIGLAICLARHIAMADRQMKQGHWEKKKLLGHEVRGKVLGVVGLGKVGQEVAKRAKYLGMKVVAHDPFISDRVALDLDIELNPLDELLRQADVVTLHAALNRKTRQLINRDSLATMKRGAMLINCARGELVDEEALLEALDAGCLSGAALDVFEEEPSQNARLLAHPLVVATPHIAASTVEAQEQVGVEIAFQVRDFLKRGEIRNAVNFPSIPPEEFQRMSIFLALGEKLGNFAAQISNLRIQEVGIRYYGELCTLNAHPISNAILSGIFKPLMGDDVNWVNARGVAAERGIIVIETRSSRERTYSNLVSIQLRDAEGNMEWVEGSVLHQNNLRLVSVAGVDLEVPLSRYMLLIRNEDVPGVIGKIGTVLGNGQVNIASFALGRRNGEREAVGILTVDSPVPGVVLQEIESASYVKQVRFITLQ